MSEQAVSLDESDGPFSRLFQPFTGALVAGHDKNLSFRCFSISKRAQIIKTLERLCKIMLVMYIQFSAGLNVGSGDIERGGIVYV